MLVSITCPACHRKYKVEAGAQARKLRCRACEAIISVPAADDEAGDDDAVSRQPVRSARTSRDDAPEDEEARPRRHRPQDRDRPARPSAGSGEENPVATKWWTVATCLFVGLLAVMAAIKFYQDVSALEAGDVRFVKVHVLVAWLYRLGGKLGTTGVLLLIAVLFWALAGWALTWSTEDNSSRARRARRSPDDARPGRRARKTDYTPVIVVGVVLGGLLAVGLIIGLGAFFWLASRGREQVAQPAVPVRTAPAVPPRNEPRPAAVPTPPPPVEQPGPAPVAALPPAPPAPPPRQTKRAPAAGSASSPAKPRERSQPAEQGRGTGGAKVFTVPANARVIDDDVQDGYGGATFWVHSGGTLHGGGGSCTFLVESGGRVLGTGGSCTIALKKGATYDSGGSGSQTIYYEKGANIVNAGAAATLIPCDSISFEH